MREVDLELDFCPKCAPEETQNPFPVQEHRFYNSFAAVVQCTRLAGDDLLVGTVSDLNIGLGGALTSSGVTALSTKCLPDKSGQSSGNTPARSQGGNSRILKTVLVM